MPPTPYDGNAMKVLIVSDLHGNLEAIRSLPTDHDELWVLGDLVNYGPNPSEAIEFVRERASLVVRGNHDDAIGYGRDPQCSPRFRSLAEETARFTMSAVDDGQREFLRALPLTAERAVAGVRLFACHATPADPLHPYRPAGSDLWDKDVAGGFCDVLLTGHTHVPFCRAVGGRRVVNPGSVGQSRHGGGRAHYAIWEDGDLRLESVQYPVEETIAKLRALPVAPEVRERLESVLRTGSLDPRPPGPLSSPA
jgi:predicted phosphodiesterase